MDVRMDEFLVIARASNAYDILRDKGFKFLSLGNKEKALNETTHLVPLSRGGSNFYGLDNRMNIVKNMTFLLEALIPGTIIRSFILCREDHTMENVFIAEFPFKRKDNGEQIDVKMAILPTDTDILVVTPFNAPDIEERFSSPNQYIISILDTCSLDNEEFVRDKRLLLELLDHRMEDLNCTVGERILDIIDAVATSTHMQCECFLKSHSHVQDYSYKVVNRDDAEFRKVYAKYGKSIDPVLDDEIIPVTDFMPIIITEEDVVKTVVTEHRPTNTGTESVIATAESYDELTKAPNGLREVLIRCPETSNPVAVKLPYSVTYVDFNTIRVEKDGVTKDVSLLDPTCPICSESYMDSSVFAPGTEGVIETAKDKLIGLQQFGIVAGSKMYEFLKPLVKFPKDVASQMYRTVKSVFQASSKIEKEESEAVKEKMLNDELDSVMEKGDMMVANLTLGFTSIFILGNMFIGIIVWFVCRHLVKKRKIKAYERVERTLVSRIKRYEQKVQFANQESDYKGVDEMQHRLDCYKMMLDKLREVKAEALGKEERYEDKSEEYR